MTTRRTAEGQTNAGRLSPAFSASTFTLLREHYLIPLAIIVLFGWVVFNGFETVERILHYYVALPYWDYWRIPQNLNEYEAFHLGTLWRQHNEHRIIFPEIVFALDMLLLHGREILPLALSFICYVATWLLLSSTLFADRALALPVALSATLLAGVITLWEGSATLLATPFQLQWPILQLAVTCSLFCLARLKENSKTAYLAGVIAAAVIANYSSGNGLLLWPLLIGLAVAMRLDRRRMLILAIAAIISIGLYFVGYSFGNSLNLKNLFTHPLYVLGFFATYLGMPFSNISPVPEFGIRAGVANFLVTAMLLFEAIRRRLVYTRPGLVLFGSYAFTLLTILITAAGRMDPTEPTFSTAKPGRYITVPLMNWAVFILLCLWICSHLRSRIVSPPLLICVISGFLLFALPQLGDWMATVTEDYTQRQVSSLSVENDIVDNNLLGKMFISVGFIVNFLPELREQHLSIYYKSRARWLGKPVTQFSSSLGTAIPGQITYTFPVRSGVKIVGWAYMRHPYTWVVLTNEHGVIVGFGRRLSAGLFNPFGSDSTSPSLTWVAFANLRTPTRLLSAYVIDGRGAGLYSIAGSIPVPAIQAASLEEAGEPVAGVTWQKDRTWSERLPDQVGLGQIPPGLIYASWSGSDANTGRLLSSTFAAPRNGCIILPVLHGPQTEGLSLELIDADTAGSIALAPVQNGYGPWEYWRVPVGPSVQHLQVSARDAGQKWGEWIATAAPLTCR